MAKLQRGIAERVESKLFKGKAIIIYGPRRVGKTTFIKELQTRYPDSKYLDCDELDIREGLQNKTSTELKNFIGTSKLVLIDEAQRVENIGLTLKLLVDNYPETQIIATGSSSFELANKILEPLTGRFFEFHMYPFSLGELANNTSTIVVKRELEKRIVYGTYPDAALVPDEEAKEAIKNIAKAYLFKDILAFQDIRNPEVLEKLLQALALQVGNEVSYNELGEITGLDKNTVSHYIQLLEKAFIVFRLGPLSRNIRNELKKLRKIYFYDTGLRNAIIRNFNPLHLRQDKGALWENFLISERMKYNQIQNRDCNTYFWRTHSQQEVDYIEDIDGKILGFEFKWKEKKYTPPKIFIEAYDTNVECITPANIDKFLGL